ncbi:hypothetical protein AB205_0138520 [Aquarana catesbeiana]|uniref:Uncharacterized protein n=1 Tax=Aquarana catesbeiana TaxID=8400 RepID=A0A2G9RME8_AQUCT|nr:hypothetical protein AB205_0138520 [Aquarana catesbeiana]
MPRPPDGIVLIDCVDFKRTCQQRNMKSALADRFFKVLVIHPSRFGALPGQAYALGELHICVPG